jgi:hypothetical protein
MNRSEPMQPTDTADNDCESPDDADRIKDFWNRHGGPGAGITRKGNTLPGISGWSEVSAADGYILRCDWSRSGSRQELQYIEKPPSR